MITICIMVVCALCLHAMNPISLTPAHNYGQANERTNGWIDGWMDGWIDNCILCFAFMPNQRRNENMSAPKTVANALNAFIYAYIHLVSFALTHSPGFVLSFYYSSILFHPFSRSLTDFEYLMVFRTNEVTELI